MLLDHLVKLQFIKVNMGDSKRKLEQLTQRLHEVELFMTSYQYALSALIATTSMSAADDNQLSIASLGKAVFWPCNDGVIVTIFKGAIENRFNTFFHGGINDLFCMDEIRATYDFSGNKTTQTFQFHLGNPADDFIIICPVKFDSLGYVPSPLYDKLYVIGNDAPLKSPDELAIEDFKSVYYIRNLLSSEAVNKANALNQARERAKSLIQEGRKVLAEAAREEDIQIFFTMHPELLYPEHVNCILKHKLGSEYVTDFVFYIQGMHGREYVFVELEAASKKVGTNSGQPSSNFTQAKQQLLDWEHWITENLDYARKNLPDLRHPKFHLIMGRTDQIPEQIRNSIRTEFSGTCRSFSTYDEVLDRFEVITNGVFDSCFR